MINVVLIAVIGHEVFPGNGGWWLFYGIVVSFIKLSAALIKGMKGIRNAG